MIECDSIAYLLNFFFVGYYQEETIWLEWFILSPGSEASREVANKNSYPDLHHLQGGMKFAHKFHLYLIFRK